MAFLGGIIGGVGSLLGGLFGSSASSGASKQYMKALQQAEQFLQGQEQQGLGNYQPYQQAGVNATNTLESLMGTPGKGLLANWTGQFTAPTAAQAAQTPGYQFQLGQGLGAMQNSAAGQGDLLTGRTLANLNNYAQGTASENYQNVFNNALTQYNSAYQSFLNNQNNQYARLMGLSGQGLSAAGQEGQFIAGMGGDIASLMGQKGAAQAAGTIGSANAWSNAIGGAANALGGGLTMSQLMGNSADTTSFNPNIWMGGPTYMPGGGGTSAPFSATNLPGGSFGGFQSMMQPNIPMSQLLQPQAG